MIEATQKGIMFDIKCVMADGVTFNFQVMGKDEADARAILRKYAFEIAEQLKP